MPVPAALLDMSLPPVIHDIDERWTMAYAAALGDLSDRYLDTTRPDGVIAHPLFPVCPEWEAIVASRSMSEPLGMTHAEVLTGVHATHDVIVHRLVRPGDRLSTQLSIVGMTDISSGAKVTTRLTTVDQHGLPVATTTQDAIYLGVPTDNVDQPDPALPPVIQGSERRGDPIMTTVDVAAGAAHVYTECARIWNPIHTDRSVARAAGLPDIILHGTATLAHGITAVVNHRADGDPELVRRVAGRFAAMVELPSTITVKVWPGNKTPDGNITVPFEVYNSAGVAAVKDGLVVLGTSP
ncbi:MAG: MaoC/PaaZ C-terminal domain-containing protein [Acidimicrobiales bacterium]|tara:strand:- start:135 stop:1022 length:888 start_codon:yes stop_codon:yes gene_type:complete